MSASQKYDDAPRAVNKPVDCALTGAALLQTPFLNKGSAFTHEERNTFGLQGLLPSNVQTLDEQVRRAYAQYSSRTSDMAKNTFMTSMKEQNEVLYYKLILSHLKELFSIIYTPTEGDAIANFSRIFRRPEGCFLDINSPDAIEKQLDSFGRPEDVDIIVVSDGEQILGIGDQGVGGVLISVAKLVLYTLCAGVHPSRGLPVILDCGTDNEQLLDDELYLGNRHPRVRGEQYDKFVDRFVAAARKRFPKAYLHFEDFGLPNARRILDKYTGEMACFNDDVQGTGCVTLAAIYAAAHVAGVKMKDLRVVIYGAGTAGTGIADQIADAIGVESKKSSDEARGQIFCVDKPGLLLKSSELTAAQKAYAKDPEKYPAEKHKDLLAVVKAVKPHVLIGTSTRPRSFTQEIVEAMVEGIDSRPIIFPLSNPTRLHEATPKDLLHWTKGKALVATGSPFDPVDFDGDKIEIAECNNSCCFPGIGLGVVLSGAQLLTKEMLVAATKALAALAPAMKDDKAALLPDVEDVRDISRKIAAAVIKVAVDKGLARTEGIPDDEHEREQWVEAQMWRAEYREYRKVGMEGAGGEARGEMGSKGRRHAPGHE
ncbi:malic-domain-containing protein [Myriangium duriaei CBS 260.36]|uniref:Malic enzyme n=1 Tax=Myriangium duriaei CBS 260.36 TaxID=1168546 RepID=A0A9P4MEW2_9PEZI|nr:malic-domain-containing protein [Myriangium duriaei CBS 260.36]